MKITEEIMRQMQKPKAPAEGYLSVTAPHIFMWFCDGRRLGENEIPVPNREGLEYRKVLVEECAKLHATDTPAILVYMGDFLRYNQQDKLIDFAEKIPNLYLLDYNHFVSYAHPWVDKDKTTLLFETIVNQAKEMFIKSEGRGIKPESIKVVPDQLGTIAHLVDYARMALLYDLEKVLWSTRQAAYEVFSKEKAKQFQVVNPQMIYRDFDVRLKGAKMKPIKVIDGKACTTSIGEAEQQISALRRARRLPDLTCQQRDYIKQFQDPETYASVYDAIACKEDLATVLRHEQEHKAIMGESSSFCDDFIWYKKTAEGIGMGVRCENSLIACSQSKDPRIADSLHKRERVDTPYTIFQHIMWPDFTDIQQCLHQDEFNQQYSKRILTSLQSVHSVFSVERHKTWLSSHMWKADSSVKKIGLFRISHYQSDMKRAENERSPILG